jgi:hypothetical protein
MKAYQKLGLSAAFALGLAGVFGAPAFAQTVADEAQCNDAKNSGDQNAIRQFCPVADWPQTVEPEVQTWIMEQNAADVAFDGDVVVGTVLPDNVQLIEVPKFTQYRWAMLDGKRVLVVPENRTVIAVY